MRLIYFIFVFCAVSLFAMSRQSTKTTTTVDEQGNQTTVYEEDTYEDEDLWYGPGFYYGVWFENEDDYWGWREHHRDYPPNHRYYDPHHPVHYHYDDGHGGGGHEGGGHGGGGHGR